MHELSVVMSIVDIALEQAAKEGAAIIDEIELDIGCLTTIEMNSFEFAWKQGVKQTILERTLKKINRIQGKGICSDCESSFIMEHLFDGCPLCGGHLIGIAAGKELRVKSLVVS
ncbi:hydrogenase maturation nickel metallochaperone HypA [soil metagenome]|jgi:hydrogenase nickel incorporation protein HypA/HybF